MRLSEQVAKRLQKHEANGDTIKIKIRWTDFRTITRQKKIFGPTNQANTIYKTAEELFDMVWRPGEAVRLIGVGVSGLEDGSFQLGLWDF